MNKRNFGRVIKRIEKYPELWGQFDPPTCGSPYCFVGHAQFIRTGSDDRGRRGGNTEDQELRKWLGLSEREIEQVFSPFNTLTDFKRWHKAGKVT